MSDSQSKNQRTLSVGAMELVLGSGIKPSPLAFAISDVDKQMKERARIVAAWEKQNGVLSTSDKIRALAAATVPRAEIARTLDIRYQHVRNVLVADEAKAKAAEAEASRTSVESEKPGAGGLLRGKIGPAGRVVIPAPVREALGLEEGTEVVFTLEGDEVRVATMKTHLRRLQARVRAMIPEGVSLVDELIAERRAEQAAEDAK